MVETTTASRGGSGAGGGARPSSYTNLLMLNGDFYPGEIAHPTPADSLSQQAQAGSTLGQNRPTAGGRYSDQGRIPAHQSVLARAASRGLQQATAGNPAGESSAPSVWGSTQPIQLECGSARAYSARPSLADQQCGSAEHSGSRPPRHLADQQGGPAAYFNYPERGKTARQQSQPVAYLDHPGPPDPTRQRRQPAWHSNVPGRLDPAYQQSGSTADPPTDGLPHLASQPRGRVTHQTRTPDTDARRAQRIFRWSDTTSPPNQNAGLPAKVHPLRHDLAHMGAWDGDEPINHDP